MRTIRHLLVRPILATALAIVSLFAGIAPATAQSNPEPEVQAESADVACGFYFFAPLADEDPEECPEPTDHELRTAWANALMTGLESYANANGTYRVPNTGFDGRGSGWAIYEGGRYSTSIASVLIAEGHLPDLTDTALWERTTDLATAEGIALVYRCKDRVAVFNWDSTGHASDDDSKWWADNGCTRYPIDGLNATDYTLSRPLGHLEGASALEELRVEAVDAMTGALASYASANGTFRVADSGYKDGGTGWAFYEGTNYPTSIASVLIDEGHLSADPEHDPLWANTISAASAEGAVLVYQCKDRVAVFARHGTAQPSTVESKWWTDNGCTSYPIDNLGATYYRVSSRLSCYDPSTPCAAALSQGFYFF